MIEDSKFISAKIEDNEKYTGDNSRKRLVVTYEIEKIDGTYYQIIDIPIYFADSPNIIDCLRRGDSLFRGYDYEINLGFGDLKGFAYDSDKIVKEILIKERVEEMTIEEIERKLGYKVKTVNKKEDE